MEEHRTKRAWYALTVEETLHRLQTTLNGLSGEEVRARRVIFGLNEISSQESFSYGKLFVKQFQSTFVYILLIAAIVSFALHDLVDGWVILFAVLLNAFVGFIQEGKAKKSLQALKHATEYEAKTVRDGHHVLVGAKELVPGDIVMVGRGDRVPADLRIVHSTTLMVNESVFTGESRDAQKSEKTLSGNLILPDQKNIAFMGSLITSGNALGIVVETGMGTALGSISSLLSPHDEPTVLQQKMDGFARKLGLVILGACILLFFFGWVLGISFLEMFTTSVAVAVSAIPEGLGVVVTIILALGMRKILTLHGLVKTLPAAETLGSASVVCTDKTGTLTSGVMTVKRLWTKSHHIHDMTASWYESLEKKPKELLKLFELSILCNDAFEELKEGTPFITGNMTDRALFQFTKGFGFSQDDLVKRFERIDSMPFDSGNKYMATLHRDQDHNLLVLKGSPEVVLSVSSFIFAGDGEVHISPEERKKFKDQYQSFARDGMRVLAVAYKQLPGFLRTLSNYPLKDCVFVGFIGLIDPVREDVPAMVKILSKFHVRTLMITGDHSHTAQAVARVIGLPAEEKRILVGDDLEKMSISELKKRIRSVSICARIIPEHKLKIIEALRQNGEVVAMTGDGVNDAPAIQKADIGVALGSGTDVAKEAADLVLLNDSFSTIGKALLEGRIIYGNIRKVVVYLLSDSFSEFLMIMGALLFGMPGIPLLASQILWKNLIGDGLPALALSQESREEKVIEEFPEHRQSPLLKTSHKWLIAFVSFVSAIGGLALFWLQLEGGEELSYARSAAFAFISLVSLATIVSIRSLKGRLDLNSFFKQRFLLLSMGTSIVLLLIAFSNQFLRTVLHLVPISLITWIQIIILCLLMVMVVEVFKMRIMGVERKKK